MEARGNDSCLHARDVWSVRDCAALGAVGALVAMVREQDLFFLIGPAADFGWHLLRAGRATASGAGEAVRQARGWRRLVPGIAGAAAFAVACAPQTAAYLVLNGHLGPSRLVTRKMTWTSPHALQILLSPEHGLVFWTPLVVVALAGVVLLVADRGRPDRTRAFALCLLLMTVAEIYVVGSLESWTAAGAFGQRRFVGLTVVLVVGLARMLDGAPSRVRRGAVATLVVVCVWWNVALAVQFGAGMMDRQKLSLRENAYNAFVVVPREIPRLLYRYTFDRKTGRNRRSGFGGDAGSGACSSPERKGHF